MYQIAPPTNGCFTTGSWFLAMSQYFEQANVYNAMNFSLNIFTAQNTTVTATSQSMLCARAIR